MTSLDRRDFFRLGLAVGPAALAAACQWDGGPGIESALARVSRLNDWMGEHVLLSGKRLAPEYPVSERSRGDFPSYFISESVPELERPEQWALEIGGEVRKPVKLTLPQLMALPRVTYTVKHHCVEGWTAVATWTGVLVSALMQMVEPR